MKTAGLVTAGDKLCQLVACQASNQKACKVSRLKVLSLGARH